MVTPPLTLHACIFWKLLVQFTHDTLNISKGSADMFPKMGENAASPAPHFLSQIKTRCLKPSESTFYHCPFDALPVVGYSPSPLAIS